MSSYLLWNVTLLKCSQIFVLNNKIPGDVYGFIMNAVSFAFSVVIQELHQVYVVQRLSRALIFLITVWHMSPTCSELSATRARLRWLFLCRRILHHYFWTCWMNMYGTLCIILGNNELFLPPHYTVSLKINMNLMLCAKVTKMKSDIQSSSCYLLTAAYRKAHDLCYTFSSTARTHHFFPANFRRAI